MLKKNNSTLLKRSVKSIKLLVCRGCLALYSSVDKLSLGVKIIEFFLRNVLPVLSFQRRNSSWKKIEAIDKGRSIRLIPYPFQICSIFFFSPCINWPRCSVLEPFILRFLFYNQSFFVISPIKSIPFLKFSRDHLRSTLGITCGRGSFAVHFGDHLRYCTALKFWLKANSCKRCVTTVSPPKNKKLYNFLITKLCIAEIRNGTTFYSNW